MSNPLRGRDNELALLRDHLARLRSGAGTSWLIEGGPGLGKSRLVEQAVRAAHEAGFAVGHGVAEPGDAAVELAGLMDALFGGPSRCWNARRSGIRTPPANSVTGCCRTSRRCLSGPLCASRS